MSDNAEPHPLGLRGKAYASLGPRTLAQRALPAPPSWRDRGSPWAPSRGMGASVLGPRLWNGTARPALAALPSFFWAPLLAWLLLCAQPESRPASQKFGSPGTGNGFLSQPPSLSTLSCC